MGNLPHIVTEDEVRDHFADCGEVESVRIPRDRLTSAGKGFGYVLFADRGSVSTALEKNHLKFKERPLRVSRSSSKPEPTPKAVKKSRRGGDGDKPLDKPAAPEPGEKGSTSKFNNAGRTVMATGRSSASYRKQGSAAHTITSRGLGFSKWRHVSQPSSFEMCFASQPASRVLGAKHFSDPAFNFFLNPFHL